MPKKEQMLTLKNGELAPVRRAIVLVGFLSDLLESEPQKFQTLLDLARVGNTSLLPDKSKVTQEAVRYFERHAYCDNDGNIDPVVRNVVLSAYQATPEGPVLIQPFRLANAEEKAIAERMEMQLVNWLRKGLRGRFPGDEDHDQSPSR